MVCDGCAEKIRKAVTALPGVHEVKVGLWRKRVRVRYEPALVEAAQLKEAVGAAGFTVVER
jgi:copper chaperone CopZ